MARSYNKYRWRAGAPLYKAAAGIGDAASEMSRLGKEKESDKNEEKKPKRTIAERILDFFFGN